MLIDFNLCICRYSLYNIPCVAILNISMCFIFFVVFCYIEATFHLLGKNSCYDKLNQMYVSMCKIKGVDKICFFT